MISLYGLVASPKTVAQQVESFATQLPRSAADLIRVQLTNITAGPGDSATSVQVARYSRKVSSAIALR